MGNKPAHYVLRALNILGPDEISKLAHVLHREEVSFKKAAGEDLVMWREEKKMPAKKEIRPKTEAKILAFNRSTEALKESHQNEALEAEGDVQIMSAEVLLLQRQITRETKVETLKANASKGYQKSNEMYVVKSQTLEGKEKIRFAATDGVLINKKQA